MKAAIYTEYGPPSVLQIKQVEQPIPKDNEVLIRVYAATVNRTDCAMLRAKPFIMRFFLGMRRPKKQILGTDFGGQIESIGKEVKSFKVGDNVFGFDDNGVSSHAQFITLSEDKAITTITGGLSYEQAAASMEGAHYAYNFINKINLKQGHKVLVNGATGAIGSAAVQLLKYYGANVTAVCNTKNIELVKSLGADQIIDFTKDDFTKLNARYNYILDTVGKSSFAKCKHLLTDNGIYISSELGYMVQNPFLAMITSLSKGKKVIFPIPSNCKRSVLLIKKLILEGKFTSVIDRTYPLDEIADAYRYVETGQKTGNVVIKTE